MCEVDLVSPEDDLVLFRDALGDIRAVAVNERQVPEILSKPRRRWILEDEHRIESGVALPVDQDIDELVFIAVMRRTTGSLVTVMDHRMQRHYRFVRLDSNWPNIVTVTTFHNAIIAVDDLPHVGLQPVVVNVYDAEKQEAVWTRVVKQADATHVVIVMNDRTHRVLHVFVPRYDYQDAEALRTNIHQRVPFFQRKPVHIRNGDSNTLYIPSPLVPLARVSVFEEYRRVDSFELVQSADAIEVGDWSRPVTAHQYYRDANTRELIVYLWRERLCGGEKCRELARPLVYNELTRMLSLSGFKRRYPLVDGGRRTAMWFFTDALPGTWRTGVTDAQIVKSATVTIEGAYCAATLATNTHDIIASHITNLSSIIAENTE